MDDFGYDSNGDGGAFDFTGRMTTDPEDFMSSSGATYYWSSAHITAPEVSGNDSWGYFGVGLDGQVPTNGQWIAYKNVDWNIWPSPPPSLPVAAESPYGFNIVEFESDPLFTLGYDFPEAALGRPSSETPANVFSPSVPLNLTMGAYGVDKVVSIADFDDSRGYITIEFDHPVVDDPNNPWGLDFIVFGNAFYRARGETYMTGFENPTNVVINGSLVAEPGFVEVSQDGVTWFTSDTWLHADSFAPTLGYKLDPANANPALFAGNKWWGAKTDPTYPVPPWGEESIAPGTNLAQIATWYNGSAGGAAFDISSLNLPATHNGRKWFKYVRITNNANPDDPSSSCEIDAVASLR